MRTLTGASGGRILFAALGAAVLYGLSWPSTNAFNLSFLAWFAFVPLFVALERIRNITPFMGLGFGFMLVSTFVTGWWAFVGVPTRMMPLTWAAGIQEALFESVPLFVLFALRRWMPYPRALIALVFLWPVWEWAYVRFPMTLGILFVGNSQAVNLSLVQFADVTGVWGITAWVVSFNVALYHLTALRPETRRRAAGTILTVLCLWLGIPALYAAARSDAPEGAAVRVAVVHTRLGPEQTGSIETVRRLLALSDAGRVQSGQAADADLYVWAESLVDGTDASAESLIEQWTQRNDAALLFGMNGRLDAPGGIPVRVNQAVLISSGSPRSAYTKQRLVPFWEGLPLYSLLGRIGFIREEHQRRGWFVPGNSLRLLPLRARAVNPVLLGTPLCNEQYVPGLWARMARSGAGLFVQPAYESWFGGYATLFANLARLRSIENRRATARAANGGRSAFIDANGRMLGSEAEREGVLIHTLRTNRALPFYTRYPDAFLIGCAFTLLALLAGFRRRPSSQDKNARRR